MKKSALTLTLLTISLLTILAAAFLVNSVQANPDWTNEDAVWKDVKTITGSENQKVSASVPNPSFIRVVGTCNATGETSKLSLTYDGGGTGGGTLYTFAEAGLHEITSNSYSVQTQPATVTVTISVENVANYNLVLQYDEGAPESTPTPTPKPTSNSNNNPTASPTSSPLNSPTASPTDAATSSPTASPTETETPGEPFPTLTVIALVVPLALVFVGGTAFWMYRKKNHP
ncbi:MAG: PT domain-containing protein [Candidatus Bathyarchaeota archaeon]|nr:PT domain-containing protein [Candidatus Bathyarchaeota archaeon]